MKPRYVIKYWHPHRGTTEDNPAYYYGTGNNKIPFPFHDVNVDSCYSSFSRAQNVARKRANLYTRCAVVEVPHEALVDNHELALRIVKAGRFTDAIRSIDAASKRLMCPYWKYWGTCSDADFLKPFLDAYLNVNGKQFQF